MAMKFQELMTLATFDEWEDANRLKVKLDDVGIAADILDERALQRFLFISRPHSAMRVRVEKEHFGQALALMKEWNRDERVLAHAVCCPECGSYSVEYPQFSRKTLQSMFFAMLSAMRFIPRQYFCQQCKFTWSPEPPVKGPELDVLNWPIKEPRQKKM